MSTVSVKFPMSEAVWDKVVLSASDAAGCSVTNEGVTSFVVEYPNEDKFHDELRRFEGMIEYEVLK